MFERLERELMEGEPWASGLVNSPVWNLENKKQENQQRMNLGLTAKQPVDSWENLGYARFWLPVVKFFACKL